MDGNNQQERFVKLGEAAKAFGRTGRIEPMRQTHW